MNKPMNQTGHRSIRLTDDCASALTTPLQRHWALLPIAAGLMASLLAATPVKADPMTTPSAPGAGTPAGNGQQHPSIRNPEQAPNAAGYAPNATRQYWTPERLRAAKPLRLPLSNTTASALEHPQPDAGAPPQGENGRPPALKNPAGLAAQLFSISQSTDTDDATAPSSEVVPQDFGTLGARFSSQRLVPLSADLQYPYRPVGKLFFTIPGVGDYVCSASVMKPRIVVTAGHCMHSGNGAASGWYTNWLFVPAFRDGAAPFGTWTWSAGIVTGTWYSGGGGVPNAADYGMLAMVDQSIGGVVRRIGQVTGWLGYTTLTLSNNHTHMLGYPCNIDACAKMHQVTAESFASGGNNTVLYGSDMRGGSSGGPWVMNFGGSGIGGLQPQPNRIIGITSYGYISLDPKAQGSSIPDSRFTSILTTICGVAAGNC